MNKEIFVEHQIEIHQIQKEQVPDAILCIHSASVANKAHYPDEFIDYLNEVHYNLDWLYEAIKHREFYVGVDDGNVVCTGSFSGNSINNIFVKNASQGTGIGKQMMTFIEEKMKSMGITRVKLSCNLTSKPFYERLGYRMIEKKNEVWKQYNIVAFEMEKDL